jgi:hypothetical protein
MATRVRRSAHPSVVHIRRHDLRAGVTQVPCERKQFTEVRHREARLIGRGRSIAASTRPPSFATSAARSSGVEREDDRPEVAAESVNGCLVAGRHSHSLSPAAPER